MTTNGDEMERSADEDEAVPDGVCEWYHSVTFEENKSDDVKEATHRQFNEP